MARATKHEHEWRIISHTEKFDKVLVGCGATHCIEIEVWTQAKKRIKVADRKYRPSTRQEFIDMIAQLEHLCCG